LFWDFGLFRSFQVLSQDLSLTAFFPLFSLNIAALRKEAAPMGIVSFATTSTAVSLTNVPTAKEQSASGLARLCLEGIVLVVASLEPSTRSRTLEFPCL
jgi:succinate-acetate transporter protein